MSNWLTSLTSVLPSFNLTYSPASIMSVVRSKVGDINVTSVPSDLVASYQEAVNGTNTDDDDVGFGFGVASIAIVSAFGLTALAYVGYKACRYGVNRFREYQAGHARMLNNVEHGGEVINCDENDRDLDLAFSTDVTSHVKGSDKKDLFKKNSDALERHKGHHSERTPMPVVDVKSYGSEVVDLK